MRGYWGDLRGFGPETSRAKSFASRAPVSLRWEGGSPRGGGLRKGGLGVTHAARPAHRAHGAKGRRFPFARALAAEAPPRRRRSAARAEAQFSSIETTLVIPFLKPSPSR